MEEAQIRRLVRQAIARHLGPQGGSVSLPAAVPWPVDVAPPAPPWPPAAPAQPSVSSAVAAADRHPSARQFVILRPADETSCIVEPSVACTHCGYCQCYGH